MCKKLFLSLLTMPLWFLAGCAVNPITGEEEFMIFPESHDITIGRSYAPEVEKQLGGKITNEGLQNYIDSVGQKIARVSHRPDIEYHFTAVNDESINALALPGGYVFITKGMLVNLTSEAQLAAILGHEITHIVARDSSNVMSNEIGISILLSAVATENTPQALTTAADITRQILGLKYSRADERTADIGGLEYVYKAGYNPYAMVETMRILDEQQKIEPIEFFSTHPNPENRIEYITEEIRRHYQSISELRTGSEDYKKTVIEQLNSN